MTHSTPPLALGRVSPRAGTTRLLLALGTYTLLLNQNAGGTLVLRSLYDARTPAGTTERRLWL